MEIDPVYSVDAASGQRVLRLSGHWTLAQAGGLAARLAAGPQAADGIRAVDASGVQRLDTAGALLLLRLAARLGLDPLAAGQGLLGFVVLGELARFAAELEHRHLAPPSLAESQRHDGRADASLDRLAEVPELAHVVLERIADREAAAAVADARSA